MQDAVLKPGFYPPYHPGFQTFDRASNFFADNLK